MKSNFLKKKHAIACFFLFFTSLSNALSLSLPPGKLVGFSMSECNDVVCYTIAGPVGFTSRFGDIFSSEKTYITTFHKGSLDKKEYFCEEFKLEVSDQIGTCLNKKISQTSEFNFSINKIKHINL